MFKLVAEHLRDEAVPLPRFVAVGDGLAAVSVFETWNEATGEPGLGLSVELGRRWTS